LNYVTPKEAINRLLRRKPGSKQQVGSEDRVPGIVDSTNQEMGAAPPGGANGNGSNGNGQGQKQVDTVQLKEVLEDTAASVSAAAARACPVSYTTADMVLGWSMNAAQGLTTISRLWAAQLLASSTDLTQVKASIYICRPRVMCY
jgi:hypothetical protein